MKHKKCWDCGGLMNYNGEWYLCEKCSATYTELPKHKRLTPALQNWWSDVMKYERKIGVR